eukprot:EST45650.1 Hypothetical protein SS50377_14222 [Spironucleus salmonicida]
MYGSPSSYGPLHRVSAVTYNIINDQSGIVSSFIRLIATSYQVIKDSPLFSKAQEQIQQEWSKCINLALNNQNIDVTLLSSLLHPLPLSTGMAIKKCIETLPKEVLQQLFSIQYICQSCGQQELITAIFPSSNHQQKRACSKCSHQLIINKSPIIASFSGELMPSSFISNNDTYVLLTGFSRKDYIFSIFSDFYSKNQFHYALSCNQQAQTSLQINDMTFLDPNKANQWIQGQGQIIKTAGKLEFYMFFNLSFCEIVMREKLNKMYEIQPITPKLQPVLNSVQHETPLIYQPQAQVTQQKAVFNSIEINWCMWLIIAILIGMFLISLVLMSLITHRLNSTMVLNDLIIQRQAFLGLPSVQNLDQMNRFLANPTNIQQKQMFFDQNVYQTISKKQLTASEFSVYTQQLYAQNVTASTANLASSQTSMDCAGDNLLLTVTQLINPTVTNLNLNILNAKNLTFTSALTFQQNTDFSQLNIDQLTTNNIITASIEATDLISISDLNVQTTLEILGQMNVQGSSQVLTSNLAQLTATSIQTTNMALTTSLTAVQPIIANFPVQLTSKLTIAENALPTLNFNQNSNFVLSTNQNFINPINFQYNGNITMNATTNINDLKGQNLKLNQSNLQNLQCGGHGAGMNCNIKVPSVDTDQQITTSTFTNHGNLMTPNVQTAHETILQNLTIVNQQNGFISNLNNTGFTTNVQYSMLAINPVIVLPLSITFRQQLVTPGLTVNAPITTINSATATIITSQIVNAINMTSQTLAANPIISTNLTANNIDTVQANILQVRTNILSIKGVCDSIMCLSSKCLDAAGGTKTCQIYKNGQINVDNIISNAICQNAIIPPPGGMASNCFA